MKDGPPGAQPLLPTIQLGPHRVSRLLIGGNPFSWNSHYSGGMDEAFLNHFTNEQIVRTLLDCERHGLNAMQSRADRHIMRALREYRNRGGTMHWIAQTASELADLHGNIRQAAACGAIAIYHHGSRTDALWQEGRIHEIRDLLGTMRDCGVQVGVGTHLPEVVEYCQEHSWDVDFYLTCLYRLGSGRGGGPIAEGRATAERFDDADREAMCRVIRATDRPCLVFKVLAASRKCASPQTVRAAFEFALSNIKPTDAVIVGMCQKDCDQVAMNARIVRDLTCLVTPEGSHTP